MPCLVNDLHSILTMHFHDVAEGLVDDFKERNDYEGFRLGLNCKLWYWIQRSMQKNLKRE